EVAQPRVELQRDQLALARRQTSERRLHRRAAHGAFAVIIAGDPLGREALLQRCRAPAPPELVEGGVPRDAEQPRAFAAAPRVEQATLAKRAFKRKRGHFLG